MHIKAVTLALASLPLAVLAACSGGSGTNTEQISALTAPEGVSVVDPNESNVATGNGGFPNAGNQFPVNSDYVRDTASIQLFDPSIRAVENANNILCEVALTRFWRFVNQAPYQAQVDTALCGRTPQATEGNGVATEIHLFTLDVERASNTSPQRVSVWLPLEENGNPTEINAELVVSKAPTPADRFGTFSLTFAGIPDGGTIMNPAQTGILLSDQGESGFRFLEAQGDVTVPASMPGDRADLRQLALERDLMAGTGAAKVVQTARYNEGSGDTIETATWRVVFDQDNVKRQLDSGPVVALSRSDFRDHVYRYNMYYNTGANMGDRVELNAGMGVELATGSYAWVGYYGAWAPPGQTFSNGDTVTSTNGEETFTVVSAPGRLMKYTRDQLLLSELGTQRFEWWNSSNRYQIAYSGVEWQRVAVWNTMTEDWDAITPPTMIDVAAVGGFLGMYSPFLGGVNYQDGDAFITYFSSELVTGSDPIFTGVSSVEMFATVNGLKSEIDLTEVNNGDVYLTTPVNISNAHKYVIDPSDMTLMLDVNGDGSVIEQVGLASGVEPTMGPNTWGMHSGPLVLAPALASMSDVFDVFDETTFYVYETGHNPWNQFVGLLDGMSNFVEFDAPIEFLYTHSTANDMNADPTYDGQQILLSYNGPGKLFGIPGEEFDLGGGERRYLPNFSLKDGTVVDPAGEFIVRAIGVEQTLEIDPGGAPQLDINDADGLVVPTTALYTTPDIGAKPTVDGPPAVVDGQIQ